MTLKNPVDSSNAGKRIDAKLFHLPTDRLGPIKKIVPYQVGSNRFDDLFNGRWKP
jgi:hypothetical protein